MALAIDTGHALYPNVLALICVEGGVLKDLKDPARTFVNDANTGFGTGPYGEHFSAVLNGQSSPGGSTFSPAISIDGATLGISAFWALNAITATSTYGAGTSTEGGMLLGNSTPTYRIPNIGIRVAGVADIGAGYDEHFGMGTTTVLNTAQHSLCTTRIAGAQTSTSAKLYVDGAYEQQGGSGINAITTAHTINRINGSPGMAGVAATYVYMVIFDKELTAGETAALHASLTGNNQFALVTGASVGGTVSGVISAITLSAPAGSAAGTTGVTSGAIVTPVIKNNPGQVLANETGVVVNIYNATTGALVVSKTGQSSNASGIITVSDALIVAGTSYAYDVILTGSRRRLPLALAA